MSPGHIRDAHLTNRSRHSVRAIYPGAPRLHLTWESRRRNLAGNFLALLRGPTPLRGFGGEPYFRDCWVSAIVPRRAFAASALWHIAFTLLMVPLSQYVPARPRTTLPRMELTWYGPIRDLPAILPVAPAFRPRPVSPPKEPPRRDSDAFHPRQTILNHPMRPNHPRQTLIRPDATPEPPKILPSLPNIVEWSEPDQPKLILDDATLALTRPKATARTKLQETASPDVPILEEPPGPIDVVVSDYFAASDAAKPALPLNPMTAPRARAARTADVAAPDIRGTESAGARLIALSAAPVPDRPPEIPPGNLSARLAISPEGAEPAAPSNEMEIAISSAGTGPAGLSISGGRAPATSASGDGGGGRIMPGLPGRPATVPAALPGVVASRAQPRSLLDRIQPGMSPEGLLSGMRIYTLRFHMPNLASATGSWILSFSELAPLTAQSAASAASAGLSGPRPLRKVDPKYPPELRGKRVEGEVVLYALIRVNGTVDSIQLVRGVDPTLDANAMQAFALWKFSPAERQGTPVEIEAVVRIPFRAVAPAP